MNLPSLLLSLSALAFPRGDVQKAAPAPAPAPAPPAAPKRALAQRYEFVTFGSNLLSQASLIVEANVVSVRPAGPSVSVSRIEIADTLLGETQARELTLLASPGELRAGQTYLLFLKPFGRGTRYTALNRIAEGDRDYAAKRRVLCRLTQVQPIADVEERALAIRDLLLEHLADAELFVHWNALTELKAFVPAHRELFGRAQRAALVAVHRKSPSSTFQRELGGVLRALGVDLDDGAPLSANPGGRR